MAHMLKASIHFDVLYLKGGLTLGRWLHNRFHEHQKVLAEQPFEAPELGGGSLIEVGHYQQRSGMYPTNRVVAYMDHEILVQEEYAIITAAMQSLAEDKPRLLNVATWCCVEDGMLGSLRPVGQKEWRHSGWGWKRSLGYFGSSGSARANLTRAWDCLSVLCVSTSDLAKAMRVSGATLKEAVDWKTGRERIAV